MNKFLHSILISFVFWSSSGFVLLGNLPAKLDVTPEAPEVQFVWTGDAPEIEEKEKFKDGQFEDLNDEDFMRELLQAAMDLWNETPGSFVQMTLVEGEATLDDEDLQHSIVVEKNKNLSTAAFAAPRPDEDDPTIIVDCDISIADSKDDARSLAYTIAHELGHCLGLGHSHSNYAAMMGYSRAARNFSLGADDVAGLIFLYPDPAYGADDPKELIGCGTVGHWQPTPLLWFLVLPLLLPAIRRTRICQ